MKRYKLKNGLTLLVDRRQSNAVAMGILIKVGSNDEQPNERGIAHFMEHMLFEGTKTRTSRELTSIVESVGGESNAITTNERTFVYTVTPKKYFDQALDMLADMFLNSIFNEKSFQKEKKVILDEIKMVHDDPKAFQWVLFLQTHFKKNRTKLPVYGDTQMIERLKRDAIVRFFKKYYTAKNMVISISGDVKGVKEKVEKAFSKLSPKPVKRWKNPLEPPQKQAQKKKIKKKTNQTYFILGYKTPPTNHKDVPVLEVIRAILDRGQSARLFNEIRTKRGLAYAVGAIHETGSTYGYFTTSVITNKKNINKVRSIILEQLHLPDTNKKEIEGAKKYIEGSLILSDEDILERTERNALWEVLNRDHKTYLKAIRKVTAKDIRRVTKKYFTKNYTETIVEQEN